MWNFMEQIRLPYSKAETSLHCEGYSVNMIILQCRLWAEIKAHKWRDLELNLSKTVEELSQDSQLIQANSKKKLRDNKKLLECSFAQI